MLTILPWLANPWPVFLRKFHFCRSFMKTSFPWICAFALVSLCGCATQDTSALRIGMTKDEVIQVMGKPDTFGADSQFEYLNYYVTSSGGSMITRTQLYTVRVERGKVVSFGIGSLGGSYFRSITTSGKPTNGQELKRTGP